jgi:hypothetical protein
MAVRELTVSIEGMSMAMGGSSAVSVAQSAASRLLIPGMPGFGKKMATGGMVPGNPSHGDIHPALLTGGETVIPVGPSKMYGAFINAMIDGKLPKYKKGKRRSGEIAIDSIGSNIDSANDLGLSIDKPGSKFATGSDAAYRGTFTQALPSAINSQLTGGSANPQDILDFANGINLPEGATPRGSRMHSGLYNFLLQQSTVSPEEQKQILDEAHKIYTDHLQRLAAEGKKVSDQELSKIASSSYDTAMEKLLKKDSTVRANYERETSAIGSASTSGRSYIDPKTGKRRTSGVSISSIKDPTSTMMDYRKIGERERLEFGDDAVQAHIMHPNLIKRVLQRKSNKVRVSGAEGVLTKQEIDEIEGSGKVIGHAINNSIKDGLNEGKKDLSSAAINTVEEVTTTTEKVMTKGQARMAKLKLFTGGPMGRMGGSMGLMAGSMALQTLPASMAKDFAASATSMASMGMMFGPWGAAAGAAIGLVTTGIGKLISAQKEHKAQSEATFKTSTDAITMFGGVVNETVLSIHHFAEANTSLGYTVDSNITKINDFVNAIAKLPKDNPLKQFSDGLKAMNSSSSIIGNLKIFSLKQVTEGMDPKKVQDMVTAILSYAGKTEYLKLALSEIIPVTKDSQTAQTELLEKLYKGAATVDAYSDKYDNLSVSQKGFADGIATALNKILDTHRPFNQIISDLTSVAHFSGDTKTALAALRLSLLKVGDKETIAQLDLLNGIGLSLVDTFGLLSIMQFGNLKDLFPGGSYVGSTFIPNSQNPEYLSNHWKDVLDLQKKNYGVGDANNTVLSATDIKLTNANDKLKSQNKEYEKNIKSLEKKKKLVDDEIKAQQKITDELKKQHDFEASQADLQTQIKEAQIRGNYLQAANLKQQMMNKAADFAAEKKLTPLEDKSAKLQAQIDKIKDKIDANNVSIDKNTTALDKSTTALTNKQASKDPIVPELPVKSAIEVPIQTQTQKAIPSFQSAQNKLNTTAGLFNTKTTVAFNPKSGQWEEVRIGSIPKGYITKEAWSGGNRSYAHGGLISGPGTGTSDSIPAILKYAKGSIGGIPMAVSNGEYIQRAAAVSKYGVGFMDSINSGSYNPDGAGISNNTNNITVNVNGAGSTDPSALADIIAKKVLNTISVQGAKNNKTNMVRSK